MIGCWPVEMWWWRGWDVQVEGGRLGMNVWKKIWRCLVYMLNGQCSGICGEASYREKRPTLAERGRNGRFKNKWCFNKGEDEWERVGLLVLKLGWGLWLRPLHTSLNTAYFLCKPSSSVSSFTYSLQVFLPLLTHLTPDTTTFLQADTQSFLVNRPSSQQSQSLNILGIGFSRFHGTKSRKCSFRHGWLCSIFLLLNHLHIHLILIVFTGICAEGDRRSSIKELWTGPSTDFPHQRIFGNPASIPHKERRCGTRVFVRTLSSGEFLLWSAESTFSLRRWSRCSAVPTSKIWLQGFCCLWAPRVELASDRN